MASQHKDTDNHRTLNISMGEARRRVDKLVELQFITIDRDEWMRTHPNPTKVHLFGIMVDFKGIPDVDFAVHACSCIGVGRANLAKESTLRNIKQALGIGANDA